MYRPLHGLRRRASACSKLIKGAHVLGKAMAVGMCNPSMPRTPLRFAASMMMTCAGLLTPEQKEEWNHFHGSTWLSKAIRAAVRFAPWTLKGLARVSETRLGGRTLYDGVLKGLMSESHSALFLWTDKLWSSRLSQAAPGPSTALVSTGMSIYPHLSG